MLERLRALAQRVTDDATAGVEAMRREYGERHAEKVWMTEFYRHGAHRFLVPAAKVMCADEAHHASPSLATKNAVFLAAVLRGLPGEAAAAYCNALPLVAGMDVPLLLTVFHAAGGEAAAQRFTALAGSIARAGEGAGELAAAVAHVSAAPAPHPADWPTPHAQHALTEGPWPPLPGSLPLQPWELHPMCSGLRGELERAQWLQLAGSTHLEALWGAFYATGEARCLERIIDVAAGWGEFMPELPHG